MVGAAGAGAGSAVTGRRTPFSMTRAARYLEILPYIALGVICAFEFLAILGINDGRFIYTLDDPYIHMAMAENIAQGHYGVNRIEFSSASSNILWPFLLAPFAKLKVDEYAPLVIDLIVSAGILALFARIAGAALSGVQASRMRGAVAALAILLMLAVNVIGLLFTGMEHSLQLFLSAALVAGLVEEHRTRHVPWWLVTAIVLGPLIRYENMALSVPALGYLLYRRHRTEFTLAAGILFASLAGFSLFLRSLGLGLLPDSIVAKSRVITGSTVPAGLLRNLIHNVTGWPEALLVIGFWLFIYDIAFRRSEGNGALSAWGAAAVLLHSFAGQFSTFQRYEIYILSGMLLMLLYVYRRTISRLFEQEPVPKVAFLLGVIALMIFQTYLRPLVLTPLASNNIFEQQYQMHRFATQYYRGPVGINDLGWVSYRNEWHVLDFMGLTSGELLDRWRKEPNPDWMDEAARKHDVKMAMIYDHWLPVVPAHWARMGQLHLGKKNITPAHHRVTFYALDEPTRQVVEGLLPEFAATLPRGVRFTFENEAAGSGRGER